MELLKILINPKLDRKKGENKETKIKRTNKNPVRM